MPDRHLLLLTLLTLAAPLAATLAACYGGDDIAPIGRTPVITLTPRQVAVAVGDTVAVVAAIDEPARDNSLVLWRSDRPEVLHLDTTVAVGRRAVARAVAPGSAVLTATVTHAGQTVIASVPATVVAR